MLIFLNPFAFLALLGLLVPLAIHLWNRQPGREVAVGSLRWLAAGANRRLRHLRLEQVALLLLRMALLAVLALAVAGPVWRRTRPGGRGVVLLSPAVADNPALAALRPTIDSLRRRGYALRWLTARFPAVPGTQWQADSLQVPGVAGARQGLASEPFLWARVRQAAGAFAGQPLFVVSTARLTSLAGTHPALPTPGQVTWQVLPTRQPATWVQQAASSADSLRLWVGSSDDARTTYRRVAVRLPALGQALAVPGLPGARITLQHNTQLLVENSASSGNAPGPDSLVPVVAQPLRVAVYAGPGYAEDARRMRAALRAAALGLPQPLALTAAPAPAAPLPKLDWLVWLADAPLPAAWRTAAETQGLRVWQESAGTGQADTARLAVAATANAPLIALYRRTPAPAPATEAIWQDGRGRPVLSRQRTRAGTFYNLHTRLLPAWGELADSPALPALLLDVLLAEPGPAARDQRALDPAQLPKAVPPSPRRLVSPTFRLSDLRPGLVLVAALLFLLERLLARRRESQALPTPTA